MLEKMKFINKEKVTKIITNKWFIVFLLIPFVKPATELTGIFDNIFDILKILDCFIIGFSYLYLLKKPSKVLVFISALEATFVLSTIINDGRIWWGIVQAISVIALSALMDMTLRLNKKECLKGFCIAMGLMAFATVCTMFIFYPNGMYTAVFEHDVKGLWHIPETSNYLWGFDNSSIFKFIPVLIIFMLNTDLNNKKSRIITFVLILITTLAFLYVRSITAALVCLLILLYYLILFRRGKTLRIINYRNCIILVSIIFVLLVGVNKNLSILQYIANKTDKVVSLNYRFKIWDNTIEDFKKNWVIGSGFEERLVTAEKLGIDHPHNIFLDIIYKGGTIAGIIFVLLLITIGRKMMKNKGSLEANVVTIGLLAFLCVAQMDYYNEQYLFFLLYILAYNIDLFNKNKVIEDLKIKAGNLKKIGILTFQDTVNYGAVLQEYALQRFINKEYGNICEVIDYKNSELEKVEKPLKLFKQKSLKGIIKYITCHGYQINKWERFDNFKKNYVNISQEDYDKETITNADKKYDKFIVGSDQVWNTQLTGNDFTYYLDFIKDSHKKNSYAASFGYSKLPEEVKEKAIDLLKDFNTLNIREKQGKEIIINEIKNKEVNVVMDPTFLLDKEEWKKFADENEKSYIVVYMIDFKKEVFDFIKKIAKEEKCKIIYIHDAILSQIGMINSRDASPEQFISLINNAKIVVTGSFHALCLSIILEKDFYYTLNSLNNRNSRLINLIELTRLENRQVLNGECKTREKIDYSKVNEKLKPYIEKSKLEIDKIIKS